MDANDYDICFGLAADRIADLFFGEDVGSTEHHVAEAEIKIVLKQVFLLGEIACALDIANAAESREDEEVKEKTLKHVRKAASFALDNFIHFKVEDVGLEPGSLAELIRKKPRRRIAASGVVG